MRYLLDTEPEIGWMLDVHSGHRAVFHPWRHDTTQTTNAAMNFRSSAYASHGGSYFDGYEEYMPADDRVRFQRMARRIADGMRSHRGLDVQTGPAVDAYFQAGTGTDYAYARHLVGGSRRKVMSFTRNTRSETSSRCSAKFGRS